MKKKVMFGLAAVAALGFTACGNSASTSDAAQAKSGNDKEVLYSGILPAADVQGILCTLKLDYDADHNFSEGDFVMVQNYINSDTATVSGLKDMSTSYSEGDFTKESKQVNGTTIEYLRLTPDAKDGLGDASSDPVYLMVNADGSLTLINSELEVPSMPALYTLAVK
ncbi:MAG: copper resistance protein NlpE N-terminal domain-containing protein [Duncaniella sp.]|nr:hypothetical protein [Bacteroides sp.]MDE5826413.1 copper resistance protein NlpE N-terminal domain-containing protein [Duncaniella sp.]MBD5354541.1 hypothetical protein [Bacteroides sp.]MDE6431742.1 copper resistance protein NlpE N-terminal domain-containing protein [Duncaniella sp.]MDE6824437.1 copper resistance protein NlpE N-terminal domain-containing protein [Duncaniella sp.]